MKFLWYIFRYEFQYWDHKWRQPEGLKLLYVSATGDILRKEYVDYSLLEKLFIHSRELQEYEAAKVEIERILTNLTQHGIASHGNEDVVLEIKIDYSRPFDMLGTDDGIDGPLNWNIETPEHLQFIPTSEILQLFEDWLDFLKAVENSPPRFVDNQFDT